MRLARRHLRTKLIQGGRSSKTEGVAAGRGKGGRNMNRVAAERRGGMTGRRVGGRLEEAMMLRRPVVLLLSVHLS